LKSLLRTRKIFLVGGPGGVGKTTIAAALGIQCAKEGFRTVVLTVDPAKRLAQALGFEGFSTELQEVKAAGVGDDKLYASMLDTQRYFDRVIERFAKRPDQRQKLLNNPLYRIMVDSLGGTHEYAAMERLLEFSNDSQYERIIVDTPPTQNAVDLLSAPQRLADFMDNSVLRWFQGSTPKYLQIFRQGTKLAMKIIQRIFGAEFLKEFAELVDDFDGMQAGFRTRNLEVIQLLQSPATAFMLVTLPTETRYLECENFLETLQNHRIPLSALIMNRIEPEVPSTDSIRDLDATPENRAQIVALLEYYGRLHYLQQKWIQRFDQLLPDALRVTIPRQTHPIHDIASLSELGCRLVF